MTFLLVYGADGTGKSVQCKSIAESAETAEHWSFATKNRKLYAGSSVESIELFEFNKDDTVNPYKTINRFHNKIDMLTAMDPLLAPKVIVIDEITLLRSWAQPVVIEEINRVRRGKQQFPITKIGEQNAAAWARVNEIVYSKLERLANWGVINDATIIAITQLAEVRVTYQDDDGQLKSRTTGEYVVDAKENVRKLADVRIRLEKNGNKGQGFYAIYDKTQDWMDEVLDDKGRPVYHVKIDKTGLLNDLIIRGVIT